jgi:hypothetical protein
VTVAAGFIECAEVAKAMMNLSDMLAEMLLNGTVARPPKGAGVK